MGLLGKITGTSGKNRDPLGIGKALKKPKKPKKTAEQLATEIRTRSLLDKEIEDEETRFKLGANKKLGRASFLTGSARTRSESASRSTTSTTASPRTILGRGFGR